MDVLSEVLRVVRLSGAVHFLAEFRQPWAVSFSPPEILAARLKLPYGSVTPFHLFIEGDCVVASGTLEPTVVQGGDVVIFPRGGKHLLASESGATSVGIGEIYPHPSKERVTCVTYGGNGPSVRLICGFLHLDQQFDPLLDSLPDMICIRSHGPALTLETLSRAGRLVLPLEQPQEAQWWRSSLDYLISEAATPGPGHGALSARLTESLFLQVLRWQLQHAVEGHGGWLAGLHDPQVGRVLGMLHASPERIWTVDELARDVGMSRAALARRFVNLIGQSPIHYLVGWRMHMARNLLTHSELGIAAIAARIGYESEASFSRAFHRRVGSPPAAWRQANRSTRALAASDVRDDQGFPVSRIPGPERLSRGSGVAEPSA